MIYWIGVLTAHRTSAKFLSVYFFYPEDILYSLAINKSAKTFNLSANMSGFRPKGQRVEKIQLFGAIFREVFFAATIFDNFHRQKQLFSNY